MSTTPARGRRFGIRAQVLTVGTAGMVSAGLIGAVALTGFASVGHRIDALDQLQEVVSTTQSIETANSDVSGWQVAYAWDVRRIGVAQAIDPTAMPRSVAEAAGGPTQIATTITGVSTAAGTTTQALGQTRVAVDELARMAGDLNATVRGFTF